MFIVELFVITIIKVTNSIELERILFEQCNMQEMNRKAIVNGIEYMLLIIFNKDFNRKERMCF